MKTKGSGVSAKKQTATHASRPTANTQHRGALPDYDQEAVGRMAKRIQILDVDLLGAHFERGDTTASSTTAAPSITPEIGIDVTWELSNDSGVLGCILTFGTIFDRPQPYEVVARFRLQYSVTRGEAPSERDLEQFAYWNAVIHAWPFWREYLSSTLNRAHLPRFIVPVLPVPR
jgi:hypothetical protein